MKGNVGGATSQMSAGNLETLSMPDSQLDHLTTQDMITIGQEASRALKNQSVGVALELARRQLQNEWSNSKPEEKRKREWLYEEDQALKRVQGAFDTLVTQAQAIVDRHKQQQFQQEQSYNDLT